MEGVERAGQTPRGLLRGAGSSRGWRRGFGPREVKPPSLRQFIRRRSDRRRGDETGPRWKPEAGGQGRRARGRRGGPREVAARSGHRTRKTKERRRSPHGHLFLQRWQPPLRQAGGPACMCALACTHVQVARQWKMHIFKHVKTA